MLGKVGDVLSILPILHHEFKRNGHKPKLLISRDYASVLDGVSYVQPVIFSGHFSDLGGAIRTIKSQGGEAIPLQVYGRDFPFQKRTPSFQLDQWLRGDAVQHFLDWPLVIDRRNRNRERDLIKSVTGKQPYLLFADFSESSPFAEKEALATALRTVLKDSYQLIRLSEVRAQAIHDLIGLYNQAVALVTIETAHLHLSRGSLVPVIALTTDLPSRWNGSAWHPRFSFHCRYGDYKRREPELIASLGRILGRQREIETEQVKTEFANGYQPTIIEGSDLMIYRYHPERGWKTKLALFDGQKTWPIRLPDTYDNCSQEDARLFWFDGKLHISLVLSRHDGHWACVVAYGPLVKDGGGWGVPGLIAPHYARNDWGNMEKNWLFFEHDRRLMCIYSNEPDQQVIEFDHKGKVINLLRSPSLTWAFGPIRGGCIVPHGTHLLRFFHSHTTSGPRGGWIYSIGAALLEPKPPFKMVAISKSPIISGNEKWTPDCFHWKANVVFPAGMMREGSGWKLAYGRNDCECCFAHLTEKDLNL